MKGFTGSLKVTFSLLIAAILSLMAYSYYYRSSTSLVPSNNQGPNLNHTLIYNAPQEDESHDHERVEDNSLLRIDRELHTDIEETDEDTPFYAEEESIRESTEENTEDAELEYDFSEETSPQSDEDTDTEEEFSSEGYLIVSRLYEQLTMASGNLLQLQCWAGHLSNLKVVKPFMRDSFMRTPLNESKQLNMLKMEDIFDMEDWDQYTSGEGYSPLVEWEEFLKSAPRKLIVIQTKYPTISYVKAVRKKGLLFPHPPTQQKLYAEGCMFNFLNGREMLLFQSKGFVVVRQVCLNFWTGDELSMKQLKDHILGEFKNDSVSIFLNEWRGLGENQRFMVKENICQEKYSFKERTKPSARIIQDADLYVQQYLGGGNSSYLAVMARYEMTGWTQHMKTGNHQHAIIPKCLQLTYQELEVAKSVTKMSQVFLSTDIGIYGSKSFRNKNYYGHLSDIEEFVEKVTHLRVNDWERTFESVAHTQDSGYIAMLQLVLVTKAKCVLFVGGGTFQRHALHLYQELHPREEDRCVKIVEKCTSLSRPLDSVY